MARCLDCNKEISGRSDKKFCNPYCKSAYHYKKDKETKPSLFKKIDRQLKTNRRILKLYNKAGKSIVMKKILIDEGFNPHYYTHTWRKRYDETYYFCYEYGYLILKENGKEKYVLIRWQQYMSNR
jgi:hypothetical protein